MNPDIDITPEEEDALAEFFDSIPDTEFKHMLEQNEQTTKDAEKIQQDEDKNS